MGHADFFVKFIVQSLIINHLLFLEVKFCYFINH
jgi:hypothetical protein